MIRSYHIYVYAHIIYVPQSRIILSLIKYEVVIITLHLKMINRLNGEKGKLNINLIDVLFVFLLKEVLSERLCVAQTLECRVHETCVTW